MRVFCLLLVLLAVPALAFGFGNHEGLSCVGCHGIHSAKGEVIFAVEANKKSVNPRTKQSYTGITALCLGCHETVDRGGMGILPVSASMSHPYGVKPDPKVAAVPGQFLRGGQLECVGCHDPHPSNPNHKYLRVDTKKGAEMQQFCAMCHSSKAGFASSGMKVFSSMDETKSPAAAPAAPAKAPAPAKKQ